MDREMGHILFVGDFFSSRIQFPGFRYVKLWVWVSLALAENQFQSVLLRAAVADADYVINYSSTDHPGP
jgi:hypothetical protein